MKTIDRNIDNLMKNLGVTNEKFLSQNLAQSKEVVFTPMTIKSFN